MMVGGGLGLRSGKGHSFVLLHVKKGGIQTYSLIAR